MQVVKCHALSRSKGRRTGKEGLENMVSFVQLQRRKRLCIEGLDVKFGRSAFYDVTQPSTTLGLSVRW